jgi:hypothetical protein
MLAVGLIPSNTGEPGGKQTGRQMTHYVEPDGSFEIACADLKATGFDLPYFTKARETVAKKKDPSKVKHTCPACDFKAWAKQGANIICGDCNEQLIGEEV